MNIITKVKPNLQGMTQTELYAYIHELEAENERYEKNNKDLQEEWLKQGAKIDELKADNARLEEGYQKALGEIAADPLPRHGRWSEQAIRDTGKGYDEIGYYCSVCNEFEGYTHKYCPNCGAKMDGGADE